MVTFLHPETWLLYAGSALLGTGAALIWTGQGIYLSRCSTSANISRNSGIFWAMLQTRYTDFINRFFESQLIFYYSTTNFRSMFFGNLFVFYQFQGKDHIDKATRELVLTVLISVAILGIIFLCTLQKVMHPFVENACEAELDINKNNENVIGAFQNAIKLFLTRDMLLLSITFLYTGKSYFLGD